MVCIETSDWENPIFTRPSIDQYFLEAVRQGLLTEFEFSSLCLVQIAQKQWARPAVKMYLLDKETINSKAFALVKESLHLFEEPSEPILNEKQMQFFLSELRFFSPVDHLLSFQPLVYVPNQNDLFRAIQKVSLNLFGEVSFEHTVTSRFWNIQTVVPNSQMIAPLGMIQAFLRAKFGHDAVDLLPVIGPTGVSELRDNAHDGNRVVSLNHSFLEQLTGVRLPLKADGLDAPGIYFPYHGSCYHSYVCSSVSHPLRQKFAQFYDAMKEKRKELIFTKNEHMDSFFRAVGFDFIDMEHSIFRPEYIDLTKRTASLSIFWKTIVFILDKHKAKVPHGLFRESVILLGQFLLKHQLLTQDDRNSIPLYAS